MVSALRRANPLAVSNFSVMQPIIPYKLNRPGKSAWILPLPINAKLKNNQFVTRTAYRVCSTLSYN